jgi:hypothetical protein
MRLLLVRWQSRHQTELPADKPRICSHGAWAMEMVVRFLRRLSASHSIISFEYSTDRQVSMMTSSWSGPQN